MVATKMTVEVKNIEELPFAAKTLIDFLEEKKVVLLNGGMGAGKTTFVRALGDILGVEDVISSPTFSIVNEYQTKNGDCIFHFDFYRINNESEAYDMGFEEYLYSGNLCLIEWPENVSTLLPENCIIVSITEKIDGSRVFTFEK